MALSSDFWFRWFWVSIDFVVGFGCHGDDGGLWLFVVVGVVVGLFVN